MKFKVGDEVEIIKSRYGYENTLGRVTEIDEDWIHPYELENFDGSHIGEVFAENELIYADKNKISFPVYDWLRN